MTSQEWDIVVEGVSHHVTLDHDWQSGRATIRVDGRLAVKPMVAGETEREVPIGNMRYVIRHLENDTFDLDLSPETFLDPRVAMKRGRLSVAQQEVAEGPGLGRKIAKVVGVVVLVLVVLGLIRTGWEGYQYTRVPWKPYSSADALFKAKFPDAPAEATQSRNINGDIWQIVELNSHYRNHFYSVNYLDMHRAITEANQRSVMKRFLEGWMKACSATILSTEDGSLSRNPTIEYVARIPAGFGDGDVKLPVAAKMRGVMALRGNRLFLVWTLAAVGDPISVDLKAFTTAFELQPPPEMPHGLTFQTD